MSEYELKLTASGPARVVTTTETDCMAVEQSRLQDVTAELAVDAGRLYSSEIATTHSNGAVIKVRDVAPVVCSEIDATMANVSEWAITVTGSLSDWQHVALLAAKEKKRSESKRARLAIDILLSLHKRYAETDRPIYAALNIDETFAVGALDELLARLDDSQTSKADAGAEVSR